MPKPFSGSAKKTLISEILNRINNVVMRKKNGEENSIELQLNIHFRYKCFASDYNTYIKGLLPLNLKAQKQTLTFEISHNYIHHLKHYCSSQHKLPHI